MFPCKLFIKYAPFLGEYPERNIKNVEKGSRTKPATPPVTNTKTIFVISWLQTIKMLCPDNIYSYSKKGVLLFLVSTQRVEQMVRNLL